MEFFVANKHTSKSGTTLIRIAMGGAPYLACRINAMSFFDPNTFGDNTEGFPNQLCGNLWWFCSSDLDIFGNVPIH